MEDIEKFNQVANAIADKLLELNGTPTTHSAPQYFRPEYVKPTYEFRVLDHFNSQDEDKNLKNIFYAGIYNGHRKYNVKNFTPSLKEGEFVNEQIKSLLGDSHQINYDNQLTQIFGTKDNNPKKVLFNLVYAVQDITNTKIKVNAPYDSPVDYHLSRVLTLGQDFNEAKAAPTTPNVVTFVYEISPVLKDAALKALSA